jgi:hypothetical protein
MGPRGGEKNSRQRNPSEGLASLVEKATQSAIKPLERYSLGVSIKVVVDGQGRPCGSVVATKTSAQAEVEGAIDAEVFPDESNEKNRDPEAP